MYIGNNTLELISKLEGDTNGVFHLCSIMEKVYKIYKNVSSLVGSNLGRSRRQKGTGEKGLGNRIASKVVGG